MLSLEAGCGGYFFQSLTGATEARGVQCFSITMVTAVIPVSLTMLGLLVPMDKWGRVLISYGSSALMPAYQQWLLIAKADMSLLKTDANV